MKGCVLMSYLSFSQRMGIKPIEVPIQTDCLNEDTRMDMKIHGWTFGIVFINGLVAMLYQTLTL